jgi:hypothetical protein
MIEQGGTLPVSAINLGLVASVSGLQAEVTKLELDVTNMTPALAAQASISFDGPPSPAGFAIDVAAAIDPVNVAAELQPGNVQLNGFDSNAELAVELGVVTGQLAIVEEVTGTVGAGLAVGELSGWSYAGGAAAYGQSLEPATSGGFGTTAPGTAIRATIIATESFASWQAFSSGFNTGTSGQAEVTGADARLQFLGTLGGADWNTGTSDLFGRIGLFLDQLRALKAEIETQIQLSAGVNLPSATLVADAGADVVAQFGIDGLLAALDVDVDVEAGLGFLNAKIDFLLGLIAEIGGDLSAGGLTIWFYDGPASQLGAALRGEIQNGLPGGSGPNVPIYGLVIAGPADSMLTFGSVFKTS